VRKKAARRKVAKALKDMNPDFGGPGGF
jgi:hypothetical protein